jgi:hypothetical protein
MSKARQLPSYILDLQRGVDRAYEIAAAMKRGHKPPADAVLEELRGLRRYFVDDLLALAELLRGEVLNYDEIEDKAGMFEPMLWQLDRTLSSAPNVMTYIWERWPVLASQVAAVEAAYRPIADCCGLGIGDQSPATVTPPNPELLTTFEKAVHDLEVCLNLFEGVIQKHGVETAAGPSTVGAFRAALESGRRAEDFDSLPGISTLRDLSLAWFGSDLNVDTFKRLRFEGALRLGKFMDGQDHDGIDAVSIEDLAVMMRAIPNRFRDLSPPPLEVIERSRKIVRQGNQQGSDPAEGFTPDAGRSTANATGTDATGRRTRMTVEEANTKAMRLAKQMKRAFFQLAQREQARRIGCSWATWHKTRFFAEAQKRGDRRPRRARGKNAAGPLPVSSFTRDLEAATGEGNRDEVLNQMIAREETEGEAHAKQQALERLIAEQEADSEPNPCEADPPGRSQKVRTRKRL